MAPENQLVKVEHCSFGNKTHVFRKECLAFHLVNEFADLIFSDRKLCLPEVFVSVLKLSVEVYSLSCAC